MEPNLRPVRKVTHLRAPAPASKQEMQRLPHWSLRVCLLGFVAPPEGLVNFLSLQSFILKNLTLT
jgi:hypothetical protein